MSAAADPTAAPPTRAAALLRCPGCGARLDGREVCPGCGRAFPEVDGVVEAIGPLTGRNRTAAAFYDGPTWGRFQPWENVFLWFQGPGVAAARRQVLRHLNAAKPGARVLEVGIGDG